MFIPTGNPMLPEHNATNVELAFIIHEYMIPHTHNSTNIYS